MFKKATLTLYSHEDVVFLERQHGVPPVGEVAELLGGGEDGGGVAVLFQSGLERGEDVVDVITQTSVTAKRQVTGKLCTIIFFF